MDATKTKPFNIDKKLVYDAYKAVKANAGAAGVDGQSLEQFAQDLGRNLYKIWNRMSSGSYFHHRCALFPFPKRGLLQIEWVIFVILRAISVFDGDAIADW